MAAVVKRGNSGKRWLIGHKCCEHLCCWNKLPGPLPTNGCFKRRVSWHRLPEHLATVRSTFMSNLCVLLCALRASQRHARSQAQSVEVCVRKFTTIAACKLSVKHVHARRHGSAETRHAKHVASCGCTAAQATCHWPSCFFLLSFLSICWRMLLMHACTSAQGLMVASPDTWPAACPADAVSGAGGASANADTSRVPK